MFFIIEKHGIAYKKTKNLQPVLDMVYVFDCFREDKSDDEVYETSNTDVESSIAFQKKCVNKFFIHKYTNSNKIQKIDEIV